MDAKMLDRLDKAISTAGISGVVILPDDAKALRDLLRSAEKGQAVPMESAQAGNYAQRFLAHRGYEKAADRDRYHERLGFLIDALTEPLPPAPEGAPK